VFPALAGVVAAATGVAGILLALGFGFGRIRHRDGDAPTADDVLSFGGNAMSYAIMSDPIPDSHGRLRPRDDRLQPRAQFIGDRLTAQFGPRVEIKYVWNIMELGYRAEDILWLVEHGLLTLGYQSSSYLTDRVPELGVVDLPFLFASTDAARAAMDGALGRVLAGKIEERVNFRILGWFENGFRHVSNRTRPVRMPADLKGLTIRVLPSKVQARTFELLGAVPMRMDLTPGNRDDQGRQHRRAGKSAFKYGDLRRAQISPLPHPPSHFTFRGDLSPSHGVRRLARRSAARHAQRRDRRDRFPARAACAGGRRTRERRSRRKAATSSSSRAGARCLRRRGASRLLDEAQGLTGGSCSTWRPHASA